MRCPASGGVARAAITAVERGEHVPQPRVALGLADHERRVALAQARVAALLAVGAGAAPVLLEEQRRGAASSR